MIPRRRRFRNRLDLLNPRDSEFTSIKQRAKHRRLRVRVNASSRTALRERRHEQGSACRWLVRWGSADVGFCWKVHHEYVFWANAFLLDARGRDIDVRVLADRESPAGSGYLEKGRR